MPTKKLTIIELQTMTWESKAAMEKEFKRAGLPLIGADYCPGSDANGVWRMVDRVEQPESQADPDEFLVKPKPAVDKVRETISLASGFKVRLKPGKGTAIEEEVGTLQEARLKAGEMTFKFGKNGQRATIHTLGKAPSVQVPDDYMPGNALFDQPAEKPAEKPAEPVAKAAAKKAAAPAKKAANGTGKSNGPKLERLPTGFAKWAIQMATRKDGVTRPELAAKSGQSSCTWRAYLISIGEPEGYAVAMDKVGQTNRFKMTKTA